MPRKAKSGEQTQAVKAGPSQQYGQGAKLEAAQKAVPLPKTDVPPSATPSAAAPPGAGAPAQAAAPQGQPVADGPMAGAAGAFDRPSGRPNEPITAGLPIGAGAGPEALGGGFDPELADLAAMRNYLPAMELLANLPTASVQTRNFVRRIRGAMPLQQPEG